MALKPWDTITPDVLTMAITAKCNLSCRHCWVNSGPDVSALCAPEIQVRRIVEEFAMAGGAAVRFTGGEPLLHPHWLALVASAANAGLKVFLQTNGTLWSRDVLESLCSIQSLQISIQVSLDGATAETHDLVRGSGAYASALKGIKQIIEHGFGGVVTLALTEMQHNLHEVPALLRLAQRLGIGSVSCGTLVQCGRSRKDALVAPPRPEQYLALLDHYDEDEAFRVLYDQIGNMAALQWYSNPQEINSCDLGKNPYLTTEGRLYPCLMCHNDEYSVSGVFKTSLEKALCAAEPKWRALRLISSERASAITQCCSCVLRDSCAGGCIGRAWGSSADLLATDDRCSLRRAVLACTQKK